MEKKEKLQKEYEEFVPENTKIKNLGEFICYLDMGIGDLEESIADLKKQKLLNIKDEIDAKIRNFFFFIFEQEEVEYYSEDNALINECLNFTKNYLDKYNKVKGITNEDNYQELYRFIEFTTYQYNDNVSYLDDLRRQLEYTYQGITFYNNHKDTKEELLSFMDSEISKFREKNVVKVKTL